MGKFRQFLTELSARSTFSFSLFSFQDNKLSKSQWIITKMICALILWRSALGMLVGKFHQFVTKLPAHDMIMVGYPCLFLFFFDHVPTFSMQ